MFVYHRRFPVLNLGLARWLVGRQTFFRSSRWILSWSRFSRSRLSPFMLNVISRFPTEPRNLTLLFSYLTLSPRLLLKLKHKNNILDVSFNKRSLILHILNSTATNRVKIRTPSLILKYACKAGPNRIYEILS